MSSDTSFNAAKTKSTSTFISAFIISASVAGIQVAAFLILRTSIRKIYAPRTYLPVQSKRSQPVSSKPWGWLFPTLRSPSESMIPTAGLDAYMYIRFLKLMIFIFAPTSCLVCIVLLPLNAVGTSISTTGLNSFAFGNIPETQQVRYVGHLLCAYAVSAWTVYLIQKEMSRYIKFRQRYLTRQSHLDLPQSRTVLVTGVPKSFLSSESLHSLTAHLPGGIKQIWISRELKNLPELYNSRLEAVSRLESAETKLIKKAVKQNRSSKAHTTFATPSSLPTKIEEQNIAVQDPVDSLIRRKQRPSHRLGFLGLFGKKVDTIDWCKEEIVRLTNLLEESRQKLDQHHPHNSAFIEFNDISAAQIFSQIVLYHKPLRMAKRYVDAAPQDIIWDNLNVNPYDERIRNMISWVITIGLVILWSFPVAFIGSLSNITTLCTTTPRWLSWLCSAHGRTLDVIQGILPPVLLALIFLALPMLLRLISRYSGVPRISEIELILMTRYYIFLVIHGFVVTTLSSGLTAAIPELSKDPSQAVTILTVNLPRASIFFMTYMITTSLTSASGALLQIFPLIIYYLKLFVLASTPRSVFDVRYEMAQPQFGTLFPNTTLLATIGLAYSITAPIMSILVLAAFTIYWVVYKYLFLFVFDVPAAHETGGRFFPLAINHVFIGLYFSQLCLAGLFFLAQDASGKASSIPEGAMMIVLVILTCFSHILIRNSYAPLTMFVPLNMLDQESVSNRRNQQSETFLMHTNGFPNEKYGAGDQHQRDHSSQTPVSITGNITSSLIKSGGPEIGHKVLTPIDEDLTVEYLARPTMGSRINSSQSAAEDNFVAEQGRTAFLHPAVWENTRPVWIPEDTIGVAKLEIADMKARKIPASSKGAGITSSGSVFVTRSPPENAEVIELERTKLPGIFSLPGALSEVARAATGTIGDRVMRSTSSKSSYSHARSQSGSSHPYMNDNMETPSSTKKNYGADAFKSSLSGIVQRRDRHQPNREGSLDKSCKYMSDVPEEPVRSATPAHSSFEEDRPLSSHELHSLENLVREGGKNRESDKDTTRNTLASSNPYLHSG